MPFSALTIAKYLLAIPDEDSGELISSLKLQKLLYYAQGYYVALHGVSRPLFVDRIYAWKHGPVVKTVYNHYAGFKSGALPREKVPANLDSDAQEFLNEIYRSYGRYSAWALREMTHRERPWLDHYEADVMDVEIPLAALHAHFKKNVEKQSRKAAR
jgi:uncharacterized phage-associated protein